MIGLPRVDPPGKALAGALAALSLLVSCSAEESRPASPDSVPAPDSTAKVAEASSFIAGDAAGYVTSAACQGCHTSKVKAWAGSHHDRAMETPTEETVLGDFGDASFVEKGVAWRFFRRGDVFVVNTQGADGVPADFEILYTFGIEPLQQYLVGLPGGWIQALTVAWDTRSQAAGGQRWFSL